MIHLAMRYRFDPEWLMAQPVEVLNLVLALDKVEQGAE